MEWLDLLPEYQQTKFIFDEINKRLDEDFLRMVFPSASEPEPLNDKETALKIFLNSFGYDIGKINGRYFFTYESGAFQISEDDFNELFDCAQSGLKLAVKTLELRIVRRNQNSTNQPPDGPVAAPPSSPEGTDTTATPDEKPPETPSEDK